MWDRIATGLSLARSTLRVLASDKKLLLFPCVSGVLTLLVVASFAVPLGVLFNEGHLLDANHKLQPWVYPVLFVAYFCVYAVIIFCNAALLSCALLKFDGQEVSLGDGFSVARTRLPQ